MNKKSVPPFSLESGLMLRRYDSVERDQQIELRLSLCPGVSFILSNRVRVSCGPKDLAKRERERRTKHDLTRKCLTFATWYLLVFSFVRPAVLQSCSPLVCPSVDLSQFLCPPPSVLFVLFSPIAVASSGR